MRGVEPVEQLTLAEILDEFEARATQQLRERRGVEARFERLADRGDAPAQLFEHSRVGRKGAFVQIGEDQFATQRGRARNRAQACQIRRAREVHRHAEPGKERAQIRAKLGAGQCGRERFGREVRGNEMDRTGERYSAFPELAQL